MKALDHAPSVARENLATAARGAGLRVGEGDDLGDIFGGDGHAGVQLPSHLFGLCVGDVGGQLSGGRSWLDEHHPDAGLQLLTKRFGPAVDAPLVAA